MNRAEHLMTIAMEECNEIAQRISKAKRFGMDQIQQDADDAPEQNPHRLTNSERIRQEFTDLVAVLEMIDQGLLEVDRAAVIRKKQKVDRYLERSARCGTLRETGSEQP